MLAPAAVNLALPKERCWSSVEQECPCAAPARKARLANEHPAWRNVGLGGSRDTLNVAADTARSFFGSSSDACACLPERGITVTAWRVHRGSHLTLSILAWLEPSMRLLIRLIGSRETPGRSRTTACLDENSFGEAVTCQRAAIRGLAANQAVRMRLHTLVPGARDPTVIVHSTPTYSVGSRFSRLQLLGLVEKFLISFCTHWKDDAIAIFRTSSTTRSASSQPGLKSRETQVSSAPYRYRLPGP